MNLVFAIATAADAAEIAALRTATDRHLRAQHGLAPAKLPITEKQILSGMEKACVLIARAKGEIIATLSLHKKRPWAIDPAYFTNVPRPIYLTNMSVAPEWQRQGVGRRLLDQAKIVTRKWPADAIRLDAYDNETGAGGFYQKCGYREVGRVTYRQTPLIYFELVL